MAMRGWRDDGNEESGWTTGYGDDEGTNNVRQENRRDDGTDDVRRNTTDETVELD